MARWLPVLMCLLALVALGSLPAVASVDLPQPEQVMRWAVRVGDDVVGHRDVVVRYAGQGEDHARVFESSLSIDGQFPTDNGKTRRLRYRQMLNAVSTDGLPASFHSTVTSNRNAAELQARYADASWRLTYAQNGFVRSFALDARKVDLSTVDLFDPETTRPLGKRSHARILAAETGKLDEGPVYQLGTERLVIGGESLETKQYAWDASEGTWLLWYTTNGFLVRYVRPMLGLELVADLVGPAPYGIDEFPVKLFGPNIPSVPL